MTIGEMNRQIDIYAPSPVVDGANESSDWVFVKSKWSEIMGETGMGRIRAESNAGGIHTGLNRYSFRVRYDRSFDITMQIRDREGNRYNIVNILHDKAGRINTYLIAEVGGSNG